VTDDTEIQVEQAWTYTVPAPVGGLASSAQNHRTLVGDIEGTCHLLEPDGKLRTTVPAGGPVRAVRASASGNCFGVLTENGVLQAFNTNAEPLWELDVEGVESFDLGKTARTVALGVPPYGVLLVDPLNPDGALEVKCQHQVASLAVLETETDGVVAAGERGELSRLDSDGETVWKYNLGNECRQVRISHASQLIVLPVLEEGIQTFDIDGNGQGAFDLGDPVTGAGAGYGPSGPLLSVVTREQVLMVMDMEGLILWDHELDVLLVDFDFTDDASLLVTVGGNQVVHAFGLTGPGGEPFAAAEPTEEISAQEVGAAPELDLDEEPEFDLEGLIEEEEFIEEELLEAEEAPEAETVEEEVEAPSKPTEAPPGAPRPKGAQILGELQLPGEALPTDLEEIFVTPDGTCAVAALPGGRVLTLDRTGEIVSEFEVGAHGRIVKRRSNEMAVVWSPENLLVLDLQAGTGRQVVLGPPPVRLLRASSNGEMVALVDEKDDLIILHSDGEEVVRRHIDPPPIMLDMSPAGSTILTKDDEGRFRFFDNEASLQRKQRIAGGGIFADVILEEGFCALGGSEGRVIVQEMSGKVLWTKRVANRVVRLESLENAIAVYDQSGTCMVLNPYGEVEMEFEPPPGLSVVRTPSHGDPILLHARRNVLTAYGGYSRKLDARWSFRCEDPIRVFESDREATFVVVASGNTLFFVEGPRE
jgi:hypothetical protein